MTTEVLDDPTLNRYELLVDGEHRATPTTRSGTTRSTFIHTEIDPAREGEGLGGELARGALNLVRADTDYRVRRDVPVHGGVHRKHPEYDGPADALSASRRSGRTRPGLAPAGQVDLDLAVVDAVVTVARQRGRGRQHGLAVDLDLGLVTRGVEDLVPDAERATALAAAGLALVAQVDPANVLREKTDADGDNDDDNDPRFHRNSVRRLTDSRRRSRNAVEPLVGAELLGDQVLGLGVLLRRDLAVGESVQACGMCRSSAR